MKKERRVRRNFTPVSSFERTLNHLDKTILKTKAIRAALVAAVSLCRNMPKSGISRCVAWGYSESEGHEHELGGLAAQNLRDALNELGFLEEDK